MEEGGTNSDLFPSDEIGTITRAEKSNIRTYVLPSLHLEIGIRNPR